MKTCINGATTMPYSLDVDVTSAAKAGFQGVEIWRDKLDKYLAAYSLEDLRRLLKRHELGVAAICPFGGYIWCPEESFQEKLNDVNSYLEVAAKIGCENLLVCAETPGEKTYDAVVAAHVERLSRLADEAGKYDVKVALEWFRNMKTPVEIVREAGHKYLGLMLDTFHWYRGDGELSNVASIPAEKLLLIHINDCEDLPREKLTDRNRLYCGLGVIPLIPILKTLKGLGYGGYLSVEVFREEYWRRDATTISGEALGTLKDVMAKAGL